MKTLKKSTAFYKDPNTGDFKSLNVIGEKTAAELKAEIEAKGQETLESIPDDYTALSEEVSQLSSEIGEETNRAKNAENELAENTTQLRAEVDTLNTGGLNLKEDFIGTQVNKWLDEHPEATTTVQDHSLTIDKMVIGTLGYVTLEMFGAMPNEDITEILQTAVDYCADNKKILVIPNGNYIVSSTIYIRDSSVYLKGERSKGINNNGWEYSLLYTGSDVLFSIPNNIGFCVFNGLNIKSENTQTGTCFDCNSLRNHIEYCLIQNFDKGIHIRNDSNDWRGENIVADNDFHDCNIAIYTSFTGNAATTDNTIRDNIIINGNYFMDAQFLDGYLITGNHDYSKYGLSSPRVRGTVISHNYFDNTKYTSILLFVDNSVSIVNNYFFAKGGSDSELICNKIVLRDYQNHGIYPMATVSNNILVETDDNYPVGLALLHTTEVQTTLNGNVTKAKIISDSTSLSMVNGNDVKKDTDITNLFTSDVAEVIGCVNKINGVVVGNLKITFTSDITAWSDAIFEGAFPRPKILVDNMTDVLAVDAIQGATENVRLRFINQGWSLISTVDIASGTTITLHFYYYTDD